MVNRVERSVSLASSKVLDMLGFSFLETQSVSDRTGLLFRPGTRSCSVTAGLTPPKSTAIAIPTESHPKGSKRPRQATVRTRWSYPGRPEAEGQALQGGEPGTGFQKS